MNPNTSSPPTEFSAPNGFVSYHAGNDSLHLMAGEFGEDVRPVIYLDAAGDLSSLTALLAARAKVLAELVQSASLVDEHHAKQAIRATRPIAEDLAALAQAVGDRLVADAQRTTNGGAA